MSNSSWGGFHPHLLRHPPLDPAAPFLKPLFPFPSFLFHLLLRGPNNNYINTTILTLCSRREACSVTPLSAESEGTWFKATWLGLGTQPHYKAPSDLWVKHVRMQWLTSDEWDCPLDNRPKLAMGQPNSSYKKNYINTINGNHLIFLERHLFCSTCLLTKER